VDVDIALGQNERIVFQAGTHSVTMSVAYHEFERLAAAPVADLAVVRSA
jgi:prolyl-tRNA editing enzyme YbaK/EbsC (Cys-tRNA(Pro) deacylase)